MRRRLQKFLQPSLLYLGFSYKLFFFAVIPATGARFTASARHFNAVKSTVASVCIVLTLNNVTFNAIIFHNFLLVKNIMRLKIKNYTI